MSIQKTRAHAPSHRAIARGRPSDVPAGWRLAGTPTMSDAFERVSSASTERNVLETFPELQRSIVQLRGKARTEALALLYGELEQALTGTSSPSPRIQSLRATAPQTQINQVRVALDLLQREEAKHPIPGVTGAAIAALKARSQVECWNFDWDDNIANMPTRIKLHDKQSDSDILVSTADYAQLNSQVGDGADKRYSYLQDSFAGFRDWTYPRRFLEDLREALADPSEKWKGPSWDNFQSALMSKENAERTAIITARGHSPDTIHQGLCMLQQRGLIAYVPPKENIYPVQDQETMAALGNTSVPEMKARAMTQILDRLETTVFGPHARKVLDPAGEKRDYFHVWGFSDDDKQNYQKAIDCLSPEFAKGRWPHVKVVLRMTGPSPDGKTTVAVITPEGRLRASQQTEFTRIPAGTEANPPAA